MFPQYSIIGLYSAILDTLESLWSYVRGGHPWGNWDCHETESMIIKHFWLNALAYGQMPSYWVVYKWSITFRQQLGKSPEENQAGRCCTKMYVQHHDGHWHFGERSCQTPTRSIR